VTEPSLGVREHRAVVDAGRYYRKGIWFAGNVIEYNGESRYSKCQKMKSVERELVIICKQYVSVLITEFFTSPNCSIHVAFLLLFEEKSMTLKCSIGLALFRRLSIKRTERNKNDRDVMNHIVDKENAMAYTVRLLKLCLIKVCPISKRGA
jgi:hypothetical protein